MLAQWREQDRVRRAQEQLRSRTKPGLLNEENKTETEWIYRTNKVTCVPRTDN